MEIIIPDTVIVALSSLGGVLIGGTITFVTQYYLSKTEQKNKNKALLRDKYEEISLTFIKSIKWLATLRDMNSLDDLLENTPKDSEKIHMLSLLYIPELVSASETYLDASTDLFHHAISSFKPEDSAHALMQSLENPDFLRANESFLKAKDHLFDEIKRYAKQYTSGLGI